MAQYPRASRITLHISPEALAVAKRAAELQGRSLSDFVVAAAQAEAERAIEAALDRYFREKKVLGGPCRSPQTPRHL